MASSSMVYKKTPKEKGAKDKDARSSDSVPVMATAEENALMTSLHANMADVEPLPDEKDFFHHKETLMRYLKARDWKVAEAEKLLRATVEWRRIHRPLHTDCNWCHDKPGYHCMRQVGNDLQGRPVIYSCFAQAATQKLNVEDSILHTTYLIENAKRTMRPGVTSWVYIVDCTGMNIHSCNPRLGYGVTQVMSNYYPERLGLAIILNHNPVFQGVLSAIKVFLHPNTIAKINLVRGKKKMKEMFERHFSPELSTWLMEEIRRNKISPIPASQREFWRLPSPTTTHDPRGSYTYLKEHVGPYKQSMMTAMDPLKIHNPHPNIIDAMVGRLKMAALPVPQRTPAGGKSPSKSPAPKKARAAVESDDSDAEENGEPVQEIEIPAELQIPADATHF